MEMMPGYKQTEVGVIPDDWTIETLGELGKWLSGGTPSMSEKTYWDGSIPWVSPKDMKVARLHDASDHISEKALTNGTRLAPQNALLIVVRGMILAHSLPVARAERSLAFNQDIKGLVARDSIDSNYLLWWFQAHKSALLSLTTESTHGTKRLPSEMLFAQKIALPTLSEQEAIAEVLNNADALIEILERLIAKKRLLKRGVMRELLTGKRRLPSFSGEWKVKRIAELAYPSSEKNTAAARLPVLTCSKHLGFVDSLGYFKNQVFSNDTSTYKLIRRGQIGYPANHVEEGSIGLQDLYEVALVSPIYVIFSVIEGVDSYFLHRVLKLDSYRQKFKTATTSSVDRRGSLRWPAFSEITVSIPPLLEQTAIAAILSTMDAEIALLEAQLAKYRQLKRGLMQKLLTGRIRLV